MSYLSMYASAAQTALDGPIPTPRPLPPRRLMFRRRDMTDGIRLRIVSGHPDLRGLTVIAATPEAAFVDLDRAVRAKGLRNFVLVALSSSVRL